jgi:dTDP-4-amino-4,6-dideoxygalactose transaminase
MPVHFGGRPLDLSGFHRVIERHDLWLVEDAAHAVGGAAAGARVGGSRHPRSLACFSFYPNKNLATAEGGAIAGPAGPVMERLRQLRLHGLNSDAWDRFRTTKFRLALATAPGFKANMTDLQAAIALPQLAKLEGFLAIREHLATRYDELLAAVDFVRPVDRPRPTLQERHALHLYQVRLAPGLDRDTIVAALQARSIGVAVHYIGVNLHPYYAPRHPEALPHSDAASYNLISLPLHPGLAQDDLVAVVTALQEEIAAQTAAAASVSVPTQRTEGSVTDRPLVAGSSLR